MEVAGAAFPITPLLSTCTKIVTILHNVAKKFKRGPLMMTSIATECSLLHVALAQLRSFDWAAMSIDDDGRQEQLTRATESIILGCTLTLSVIEEFATELQDYVDGAPLSPTEQMGIMARVRVLWKEEEMRELLLQLRGYQTGLTSLIRAAYDCDLSEAQDALSGSQSNYTTLLQRSRSSRARKPLSIRAAMQQAATYTSISRAAPITILPVTAPVTNGHSQLDTSSSPTNTSGSSTINLGDGHSPVELYNGGGNTAAGKKSSAENTRRKPRPAFLNLQVDPTEMVMASQVLHSKRSKDQMRKSSPTVGEKFVFIAGEPPKNGTPLQDDSRQEQPSQQSSQMTERDRRPRVQSFLDPPLSSPPQVPLPDPPSRTPSRSRSPAPVSPVKSILRKAARPEGLAQAREPRRRSQSPSKSVSHGPTFLQEEPPSKGRELERPPTPPTPRTDGSVPPTPRGGTPQPQARKQKSSSSVRDQIMVLPETARLRKQASNDLLRKQSSAELLGQSGFPDPVPAMPSPAQDRYIVGNAFGKNRSRSPLQPGFSNIPRTPSFDMLTELSRNRPATEAASKPISSRFTDQQQSISQRGMSRSNSEVQRPSHLKSSSIDIPQERHRHSPTSDAATTPSTLASVRSLDQGSAGPESWPLSPTLPAQPEIVPQETQYGVKRFQSPAERYHARSPSSSSVLNLNLSSGRSFTPDVAGKGAPADSSRGHSRQRSRSNTLMTIDSEVTERENEVVQKGQPVQTITERSEISQASPKATRDRSQSRTRVSRAEIIPWEYSNVEPDPNIEFTRTRYAHKPRLVKALGKLHELDQDGSPPRSPLLTDHFLTNVKAGLPKDEPANQPNVQQYHVPSRRASTSQRTQKAGQSTVVGERKKKDKQKDSRVPAFGELTKEYKEMNNARYQSRYQHDDETAQFDSTRPSTGRSSISSSRRLNDALDAAMQSSGKTTKTVTPRPSTETGASMSSESGASSKRSKKERNKGGSSISMKELWRDYKKSTNAWYSAGY